MKYNKKYFRFKEEDVAKIVSRVKHQKPDIEINYWLSKSTLSFYIRVAYKDYARCIRLSDHESANSTAVSIIITHNTKVNTIIRTINRQIELLKKRSLNEKLNSLDI